MLHLHSLFNHCNINCIYLSQSLLADMAIGYELKVKSPLAFAKAHTYVHVLDEITGEVVPKGRVKDLG